MNQGLALRKTFARRVERDPKSGPTREAGPVRTHCWPWPNQPWLPTHAAGGLQPAWMQTLSFHFKYIPLLPFPASHGRFLDIFHSFYFCFYNPALLIYSH